MHASELELISRTANSKVLVYGTGNERLAIKMVQSVNKKECQLLKNQFKILQILNHTNIIQAYRLKQINAPRGNQQLNQLRQSQIALVLEYANQGSLLDFIQKQNPSLRQIKQIALQIARGLSYIHSMNLAHRDLKLENILVFSSNNQTTIKIGDFGLASITRISGKNILFDEFRGTQRYMAPQIQEARLNKQKKYEATKTDIFSFGVLLFAILFKTFPFEKAIPSDRLYILIIQRKFEQFWISHGVPSHMQKCPKVALESFMRLFEQLVCYEPAQRLSMDELLQAQFLIQQV